MKKALGLSVFLSAILAFSPGLRAQSHYDAGATDDEIRIGNAAPYSGTAAVYSEAAKITSAYFEKVNAEGGINGRKVTFISYDNAWTPAKTVEAVRKLVEQDKVLAIALIPGTPTNSAVSKYLNTRKIPHLFANCGASKFNDHENLPWSSVYLPTFFSEGRIYGKYILRNHPDARIAVLYQNDDYGKDVLNGLLDALGNNASQVVAREPYELSEPTVDAHILKLADSGADVFVNISMAKAAAQSIRKVKESGWNPKAHIINYVGSSIGGILTQAGLDNAKGLISGSFLKDPTDPIWKDDPETLRFLDFINKHYPQADLKISSTVIGYVEAQTLAHILQRAGHDLTRENILRQANSIVDFRAEMSLPGIVQNTSETDHSVNDTLQLQRFDGTKWVSFGPLQHSDEH
jgi:branched-chain amino acid transport system substrate-binding protein